MKIYDAIAAIESRRPINHRQHVTLDDFLLSEAERGDKIALKLLDAEELLLPADERTLRQLRHPKWKLNLDNLPPGISGEVTAENERWTTDSTQPYALSTIYTRSPT